MPDDKRRAPNGAADHPPPLTDPLEFAALLEQGITQAVASGQFVAPRAFIMARRDVDTNTPAPDGLYFAVVYWLRALGPSVPIEYEFNLIADTARRAAAVSVVLVLPGYFHEESTQLPNQHRALVSGPDGAPEGVLLTVENRIFPQARVRAAFAPAPGSADRSVVWVDLDQHVLLFGPDRRPLPQFLPPLH